MKRHAGKWVWSTAYSILVQVCWNAGTFFLILDVNTMHSTLRANNAKWTLNWEPYIAAATWLFYLSKVAQIGHLRVHCLLEHFWIHSPVDVTSR